MTTNLDQLTADAELSNAFASQVDLTQQDGGDGQQAEVVVETPTEPSSPDPETTEPSSTKPSPSRDDIIESLTLEELIAHPTKGKALQSWKDSEAAKKLAGTREQVRKELEEETRFNNAKKHFESLSPEELGAELAANPEARAAYARIQTAPTPPPPEVNAQVNYYADVIQRTLSRLKDLPADVQEALDGKKHLVTPEGGDPNQVLADWTDKVTAAIIEHAKPKKTPEEEESDRLNREASQTPDSSGALLSNGASTRPPLDLETTPADDLLEDAFKQTLGTKKVRR